MGMRPAIASMPSVGEVRKAPIIQRAALRLMASLCYGYGMGLPILSPME